uniref:Uncharacterized protein n=1 Tax=Rousettus aegyptiacus TaxID=9407 RepID=A0A7J8GC94_ROUAE|nr:hypothetical protein HJG63_011670 [Rousettus aegyptiacus]
MTVDDPSFPKYQVAVLQRLLPRRYLFPMDVSRAMNDVIGRLSQSSLSSWSLPVFFFSGSISVSDSLAPLPSLSCLTIKSCPRITISDGSHFALYILFCLLSKGQLTMLLFDIIGSDSSSS